MPEAAHERDLIAGHGAEAVVRAVGERDRLGAVAIAPEVGGDHRIVLRQERRDPRPHGLRLRIAVQEEHRRTLPADHVGDLDIARREPPAHHALEHATSPVLRKTGADGRLLQVLRIAPSLPPSRRRPGSALATSDALHLTLAQAPAFAGVTLRVRCTPTT